MKKFFALLLMLALLLSLAACGGSVAPAPLAPANPIVGTWDLAPGQDRDPGYLIISLESDGSGYFKTISPYLEYDPNLDDYVPRTMIFYTPGAWEGNTILWDGEEFGTYTLDGDDMIVTTSDKTYRYVRVGDVSKSDPLKPGTYRLIQTTPHEGNAPSPDDSSGAQELSFLFNRDGTGSFTRGDETASLTWDKHFLYFDGNYFGNRRLFYSYDGAHLTVSCPKSSMILVADD